MVRFAKACVLTGSALVLLAACAEPTLGPVEGTVPSSETVSSFESEEELDQFAQAMLDLQERNESVVVQSLEAPVMYNMAEPEVAEEDTSNDSITNTQEAGVDEGGIVKNVGDYLVVLRRGRLFTVRVGGDALAPVDAIDAFPPGAAGRGAWYDEMLVRGSEVIVIGYSYSAGGTELNRFHVGGDGSLTYRDTHYLKSGDYYSSSNYASRLIGDQLVFYAPLFMNWEGWRESLPTLRTRQEDGSLDEGVVLSAPEDIHISNVYRDAGAAPAMLHTVTRCDLAAEEMTCEADSVLGDWSRTFYVSRDAVYVWTGQFRPYWRRDEGLTLPGQLFRLPLDGSAPGAVAVTGGPIDQFSFREDAQDEVLRVVLRGESQGDAMWASEFTSGDVGLLTVPLDSFTIGDGNLQAGALRELPDVDGWSLQNRFVGRHLLYSANHWNREGTRNELHVVPLDGGEVTTLAMPHSVSRLDVLGRDAVAVGANANGALGFSAVSLAGVPAIESTFLLPASGEGESRSQAFFYRPDAGSDGDSGTLGLPVRRSPRTGAHAFLGRGSAIAFLRRDSRQLSLAGELEADGAQGRDDNCLASCVDWYGNARPIFMRGRVFALMGYELVEGRMTRGQIAERRRVDFSTAIDR